MDTYVFANQKGGVGKTTVTLGVAAELAARALRVLLISIALLANRFDVLWVMRQVGHADSHMTMDVYAQLQQRAERQHGEAFDDLVRKARERLYGTIEDAEREDAEPDENPRLEDVVNEWRDERDDL